MTIIKHIVIAFMAGVFTMLLVGFPVMMLDMARKDDVPPVAISEMFAEAAAGHVEEITVRGTRYEYRVSGRAKVAYGPKTTAAELAPLAGSAKIDVK